MTSPAPSAPPASAATVGPSPLLAHRTRALALAAVVLLLDLGSKQWALTHLANAVHPLVVTPADGAVAAALTARGVPAAAQEDALQTGLLWRYRKATGLKATDPVAPRQGALEAGLDLVALDGTGLPPPRRWRPGPADQGRTLGAALAEAWRVDEAAVQAVLDRHVVQADAQLEALDSKPADGGAVVLREHTVTVVDRFMMLVYAENFGAAFSFLASAPAWLRHWLFVTVSLVACVAMSWTLWRGRMDSVMSTYAIAAVLGGAAGNLFDRLRFHAVVDFVYNFVVIGERTHGWPVWNIADAGITVGIIAIGIEVLLARKQEPPAAAQA
jgi:signal peptidase II